MYGSRAQNKPKEEDLGRLVRVEKNGFKRATIAISIAAILTTGYLELGCSNRKNVPKEPPSQRVISGSEYQDVIKSVVRYDAARILNVKPSDVTLSVDMSQNYRIVGLDTEFSGDEPSPAWLQANAGKRSVLYNIGGEMKNRFENTFTHIQPNVLAMDAFLRSYLEFIGPTATIIPAANDNPAVFVTKYGYGGRQDQTKIKNGEVLYTQSLYDGYAFRKLGEDLALNNGLSSVLRLEGEKFVKDKPYGGTLGGDNGYYIDDRESGVFFMPTSRLFKCPDVDNPDSCVWSGYRGNFFNNITAQNNGGRFGLEALLLFENGHTVISPIKQGKDDSYKTDFGKLVPPRLKE